MNCTTKYVFTDFRSVTRCPQEKSKSSC